jgi:hypothetical protein
MAWTYLDERTGRSPSLFVQAALLASDNDLLT